MGLLLRNWHLKLSAVLLSTVLYTGLVFSGSFTERTIDVRVDGINQPNSSQVLSGDFGTVNVTYRTSNELSDTIGTQAFVATVDLSQYDMARAPEPQVLDVVVAALPEGVEVLETEPQTVRVAIDRVETRTVPVEVDSGVVPEGLEIGDPVLSQDEVQVRGASSVVGLIDRALARIRIDASGDRLQRAGQPGCGRRGGPGGRRRAGRPRARDGLGAGGRATHGDDADGPGTTGHLGNAGPGLRARIAPRRAVAGDAAWPAGRACGDQRGADRSRSASTAFRATRHSRPSSCCRRARGWPMGRTPRPSR